MTRFRKMKIVLFALLILLCMLYVSACGKGASKKGLTVAAYKDQLVFEYMTDATVPSALVGGVPAEQKLFADVKYKFTSPEYEKDGKKITDVYESNFPAVYCNRVGEWSVDYIYDGEVITKTFEVKDTIAPTLKVMSRPFDVWVSQDKQYLPSVDATDISGLDYDTMKKTVTLNGEQISIDALDRYSAEEAGEVKYTLTVSDIYGNESTIETKWNVKDKAWKDKKLEENYLADFDSADYVNSVESGYVSAYWSNTEISEEYLEEFEGQKGVLKLSAPTNSWNMGAFKVRLSKSTTAADLLDANKYIVIMMYTSQEHVRIACEKWSEVAECAHHFAIDVKPNCWNKIVLSTADLKEGFDDRGTDISMLQFCFGDTANLVSGDIDLYLASITTASYLDTVKEVKKNNNTMTWTAVKGADGYEVIENNKTQVVNATKYTCKKKNSVFAVRAITDDSNVLKLNSDVRTPYIDRSNFADNDIATMNSPAYKYLFRLNDYNAARRGSSIKAEYLASYKGEKGVIKVTTTNNSGAIPIGDIVMDLMGEYPEGITVRYMIEKSNAKVLRFFQPHTEWGVDNLKDLSVANTWQTAFLDYSKNYTENASDRVDMMIQGGTQQATNVIYFAYVKKGDCLSKIIEAEQQGYIDELKESLPVTQLANFDDSLYAQLVQKASPDWAFGDIKTEWLKSYKGEKGVLKITMTTDDLGSTDAAIKLKLLGDITDGFTVKYRWEQASSIEAPAVRWRLMNYDNTTSNGAQAKFDQTFNKWITETIPLSSLGRQTDAIGLYVLGPKPNTTYTLYLSYIDNYVK